MISKLKERLTAVEGEIEELEKKKPGKGDDSKSVARF